MKQPRTSIKASALCPLPSAFCYTYWFLKLSVRSQDSAFAPPTRDANNRPTRVRREQAEETLSYYTFLTLNTSFTGKDALVTQLVSGNGNSPANQLVSAGFFNCWGTPFLDQTGVVTTGDVAIRELSYSL